MSKIKIYITAVFLLLFLPGLFAESNDAGFDIYVCGAKYVDNDSPFGSPGGGGSDGNNYIPLAAVKKDKILNPDSGIFFPLLTSTYEREDEDAFNDIFLYFVFWDKSKNKGLLLGMSLVNENKLTFYFPLNVVKEDNIFYAFGKEHKFMYITRNKFVYDELRKFLKTIPLKDVEKILQRNELSMEVKVLKKFFQ